MRADRLISIIMLLEAKGPLTAQELARELEVSQRTIYRDIEALSLSGVPVYGATGPEGGYQLMEGYRSELDGLNTDETLALLTLDIPEQLHGLEFGSKLKAAILKLRSRYSHLSKREEITNRLHMDTTAWQPSEGAEELAESTIFVNTLYRASAENRRVKMLYSHPAHPANIIEQVIEPYGVVTKEGAWYLVYYGLEKVRVLEVARIIQLEQLVESFEYPTDFQLKTFWEAWCAELGRQYTSFGVKALVPRWLQSRMAEYMRQGIVPFALPVNLAEEEWVEVELYFRSFEEARSKLLSFGGSVRVLEPLALRYSLLDYAEQVVNLYQQLS